MARVDFHLHSHASNVTDYYASNSLAIPESYSDPFDNYRLLKSRGMDLVTLTDHNSIDGVKALLDAGLDDVFISAEMTTTFPEDGCNIHVTVANVAESEFKEIDRLRGNVYEMVDFLDELLAAEDPEGRGRKIGYFMTHPLMSTQNRPYGREGALSVAHIEKALLLFNCLEIRNGTRARSFNGLTARLLASLDPGKIELLANRHGLSPKGPTPWLKAVVGGSDDHSGINPGLTWTEFEYRGERPRPNDVIDSMRSRVTRAGGKSGGPVTLAHALVKLLYDGQHSKHRNPAARPMRMSDPINLLLAFAFEKEAAGLRERSALRLRIWFQNVVAKRLSRLMRRDESFERILLEEAQGLLAEQAFRDRLAESRRSDDKIFLIISTLLNRLFVRYAARIKEDRSGNLIRTIKETIALISSNLLVSLPYFVCYSHQSTDKMLLRDVRRSFDLHEAERIVLVTDTFFEVNGVALTIRRIIREAERRGIDLCVVTCLSARDRAARMAQPEVADLVARGRLEIFESIIDLELPEYRELQVHLLPFLEFLRFAQERGFSRMQVSTPGPVGAMALMAAKILQIETSSTYHTSFPEYVENYTGDISLEALTWKYMILFYHSVDEVVVPSRFIAQLLHKRGLRNRKLLVLDRWVDLERFHPDHRRDDYWDDRESVGDADCVRFVYVGRLGAEKNLDLLAEAFRRLHAEDARARLVLIGDGPYRDRLVAQLAGLPVTFTGFLGGCELPRALASADVKVFPSTTDTWGNAPLEAQAAGLPVIVTDKGGPQELMQDGVTGFRILGGNIHELMSAMRRLMEPDLRLAMGRAARRFAEENDVEEPYSAIIDPDGYRRRRKDKKLTVELTLDDDMAVSL